MSRTEILFCRPVTPQAQEDRLEWEAEAAEELGIAGHAVVLEDVVDGAFERVLERLPRRGRRLLYRGWMLTEDEYTALDEALREEGHALVVSPEEYAAAHYLPNYHPEIEEWALPALWTSGPDAREAWEAARTWGEGPWVLKDHVKSAKEFWSTSCFVPRGATREQFLEVCENLLEARGERFERGFVIRPYVPLRCVARTEERTLNYEFRLFFAEGRLFAAEARVGRVGGGGTRGWRRLRAAAPDGPTGLLPGPAPDGPVAGGLSGRDAGTQCLVGSCTARRTRRAPAVRRE